MKFVFGSLVLFVAISAYAADYTAGTKCPAAVNHKPMAGVEYEAGKNASGYAVAPADQMPSPINTDDLTKVKIPLNMPVAQYLDKDKINLNTERMELSPGEVSVNAKTGDVAFNGSNISGVEPTSANPDCWR